MTIRTLNRIAAGLLCAAAIPLSTGCHTTRKISTQINDELFTSTPLPATSMGCMWKKQIAHLPDPTQDGVLSPGIVGKLNLYGTDGLPTKTNGDLQVMAYDETPRPAGQSAAMPQMWHIDPDTLKKKLATLDDREMPCSALFLPWPNNWKDVTKIRIQVKYTPKEGTVLTSSDQVMAFESAPQPGAGTNATSMAKTGPTPMRGVPDLKKAMQQMTSGAKADTAVAANAVAPPKPLAMPTPVNASPIIVPASAQTPAAGPVTPTAPIQLPSNVQPIIVQEPAPMPLPTPPAPPVMPTAVGATPMPQVVRESSKEPTVNVTVGVGLPELNIPAAK